MRSRETKKFLLELLLTCAAFTAAGALLFGAGAALAAALCGGTCLALAAGFCVCRAREIDRLSEYLASVYTGGEILDIRTQREGELNALRDDIYKITTILGEQKAALEEDKRLLADFLGDVAHQLKTPIAAILLQTELWEDEAVPAEEKDQCASRVSQAAERMGWLVEQLLKLCRLDAAVVRFERKQNDALELLRAAAQSVQPLCADRGVAVEWAGPVSYTHLSGCPFPAHTPNQTRRSGRSPPAERQPARRLQITIRPFSFRFPPKSKMLYYFIMLK